MNGLDETNLTENINQNTPLLDDDSDYDLEGFDRSIILDSLYLNSEKVRKEKADEKLGIHESVPLNTSKYFGD